MNKPVYASVVTRETSRFILIKLVLIVLTMLLMASNATARNWQLMLVPEAPTNSAEPTPALQAYSHTNKPLNTHYKAIEQGLASSITSGMEKLIEHDKVFESCQQYLCGQADIPSLMAQVTSQAPEVNLIVLYSFATTNSATLYIRLLDPLSLEIKFSDSLSLVGDSSLSSLVALGQDMGMLIEAKLSGTEPQRLFTLYFDNYLPLEVKGLSSVVLANHHNSQFVLRKSSTKYYLFERYFPVVSLEYSLVSSLNANQLSEMLIRFFDNSKVKSNIHFTPLNLDVSPSTTYRFERKVRPYTAHLLSAIFVSLALSVVVFVFAKRRYLNAQIVAKSENEEWIRDKLAKATKNYRQDKLHKAFRQLYQARDLSYQDSINKKQSRAITKVIAQLNNDYIQSIDALNIRLVNNGQCFSVFTRETVHIGRFSGSDEASLISTKDAAFYLNHKWVSRVGLNGYVKKQASGFCWVDSASKNGSYINTRQAIPHQPISLHNKDILEMGESKQTSPIAFEIAVSDDDSILQMSLKHKLISLIDKHELAQLWPDYARAFRTTLVCLHDQFSLAFNTTKKKLQILQNDELLAITGNLTTNSSEKGKLVPLCIISLGIKATIQPIVFGNTERKLTVNAQRLLGEVPLLLPCDLRYNDINVHLSHNKNSADGSNVPNSNKDLMANSASNTKLLPSQSVNT
jgi:hypothetical protein